MDLFPVDLYYENVGTGIPVVLIHGFPLNHQIWEPVLPILSEKVNVILPDLRGHGRSPATDGIYPMRLMAEDIARLLDKLEIEKAILVGHSMGGYVALAFAHAYPNRLSGLGLIASQAADDSPEKRQDRYKSASYVKRYGLKRILSEMPQKLTSNPGFYEKLTEIIKSTPTSGVIGALMGMAERENATEWLPKILCPTVVVHGKKDSIVPEWRGKTMVQLLNRGWLVEIEEAGHLPMMETPEIVAEAILQLSCRVKKDDKSNRTNC